MGVVGCGSSGDSPPLTKAEFIKQGDAICEKTDKKQTASLKSYSKQHPPKSNTSKAAQEKLITTVGLPPIQTEAEELAALSAPSGDEEEIDAIVEGIEKAVEKGEDDPSSLLTASGGPFEPVNKLAGNYGFKACNNVL